MTSTEPRIQTTVDQPVDTISLREILSQIIRSWRTIAVTTALVVACCVLAGIFLPKQYESSVVLSPGSDQAADGNLGGIAARIGGLSSLIGLGGAQSGRKAEAMAMLQSDALAVRYIEGHNLLPLLFSDKWDQVAQKWTVDDEFKPSLWLGGRRFRDVRRVSEDSSTGLVEFTIRWTDPVLAARWANDLVALTNESLRQRAILRSERNIAYLNEQASKTSSVEVRSSIYALLQEEIKSVMLAKGNDEYALRVLDPAVTPERPISAGMMLWVAVGLVGGAILGVLMVMIGIGFRR